MMNLAMVFLMMGAGDKGGGGFQEIQIQQVLKPIRPHDTAMTACANAKQG